MKLNCTELGLKKYLLLVIFGLATLFSPLNSQAQGINVILDTDIDSDVDDVGALAMLHTLADHNRVEILGVIVTSDDPFAPGCTSVINQFFGRPDIPIGVEPGISLNNHSRYTRQLSEEFPGAISDYDEAEDAVQVYRRLLANAQDSSVVLISIGHLTNVARLLDSSPDSYSDLNGVELVAKKVKLWSCMGGHFPEGKEANFYRPDPASTVHSVRNWPGRVVFAGWEIGQEIITGGLFLRNYLPEDSPVWRAYQLYNNFSGRQSWDQASVLYAISPEKDYWQLEENGQVVVAEDGSNTWEQGNTSNQAYLKVNHAPEELAKIIDALMVGVYSDGF